LDQPFTFGRERQFSIGNSLLGSVYALSNEKTGTSNVSAPGPTSEHKSEEQSEYGSDQSSGDGGIVERLDASAGEEEAAAVRQTRGPENYANYVHGGHLSMSKYCHTSPLLGLTVSRSIRSK
jgi:hypothetical protein